MSHDHDHDGRTTGTGAAATADDRRLFRLVGAVHLGLAGAGNLAAGVGLAYLGATGRLVRMAFAGLDAYVTQQTLVREAPAVAAVAETGALVAGVVLALVGVAGLAAAVAAARDPRSRWWLPASLAALLDPLVAPLALVAAVLLWLGREPDADADADADA
jgi:hypothetical protein